MFFFFFFFISLISHFFNDVKTEPNLQGTEQKKKVSFADICISEVSRLINTYKIIYLRRYFLYY